MNKKDRVALSISLLTMLPLYALMDDFSSSIKIFNMYGSEFHSFVFCLSLPLFYWALRFVKNDISFFKVDENRINKKDRFAISYTLIFNFPFWLFIMYFAERTYNRGDKGDLELFANSFCIAIPLLYWLYRFIKNDISFINFEK